jgi:hypothetical protein
VGVPAVVALTGHPKSFVLAGAIPGGRYIVEGSNDGGRSWDILIDDDGTQTLFTSAAGGAKTVDCIVEQVRVRCIRAAASVPSITMGAPPTPGPSFFGTLQVPSTQGLGTPLDLGLNAGPLKTFTVRGAIPAGARFGILASMDGVRFDEVIQFTADQQGARSREVMCRYLRVLRGGALGPAPAIAVGGESVREPNSCGSGGVTGISTLSIASEREYTSTQASTEELFAEYVVPFPALAATALTLEFSGIAWTPDADGAIVRVRIGGTLGQPDGEELASLMAGSDEVPLAERSNPFAPPVEPRTLVKVTGFAPCGRAVLRGFELLFHT